MSKLKSKGWILLILVSVFLQCCEDTWEEKVIPDRDPVQKGFTYDILKRKGNFNYFLEAIQKSGYQALVEGKGLSTMFVPTDVAFRRYLLRNGYNSIDDIPEDYLKQMMGQHILRYSYGPDQLLNFQPRINIEEYPAGIYFRHWTVYQDGVEMRKDAGGNDKFLTVFNPNLFKTLGIKDPEANYKYFFPKSNWLGTEDQLNPANAAVIEPAIPTDNGYVYVVDNVIEPLRTIYKVMEDPDNNFNIMRELYDRFPGYRVINADYDERYADGTGNNYWFFHYNTANYMLLAIACEWTTDRPDWTLLPKVTYNGFVPNDEAMTRYFREFWGSSELSEAYKKWEDVDHLTLYYFLRNHFTDMDGMAFPEMLRSGLSSDWGYPYEFDVDMDVNFKEMCGNGVIYGLTTVEEPPLFRSVARPAFQSPKYSLFGYMLDKAAMLQDVTNRERELTLFIPSNDVLQTEGYTLNRSGAAYELDKIKVRSGTSDIGTEALQLLVKNQLVNGLLTPANLSSSTPTWIESDREDSYLKIGNGKIEAEDGTQVQIGSEEFNANGRYGTWRAYEVKGLLGGGSIQNFYNLVGNTNKGYTSILKNYRNDIIMNSEFETGSGGDLYPFRNSRGLLFVTMDTWARPGENGVPEANINDKYDMTRWLNKHAVSKTSSETFKILDFLTGDVVGSTLKTLSDGFSIKILDVEEVVSSYGTTKMTIQLPVSENSRIVEAYGPHFSKECMFYILTTASNRFVWEE